VKPLQPVADRSGQSVAIIGAGPAGLTVAEALRVKGYDVHVYDRHDRAGGLLTYGIPGFKLEKPVVMRRVERLAAGGVHFHQDFAVGRDASLADLRAKHDAVLIATGVYKARQVEVPGADGPTTMEALDFLIAANKAGFGDVLPDAATFDAAGKHVVVIGGGDTAMDCVRTAIRQGAASVKCLYRRDRANMPGSAREVANAEEEGVEFVWLAAPAEITPNGVAAQGMRLGQPGADGRRSPEPDADNRFTLPADLVIKALGFDAEDLPTLFGAPQLPVTRWGTVRIDHKTMMTGVDGVFAAGDIVRGASLVVWAVRDGRDVAAQMHQYLRARVTASAAAA
jgi:glutamate synthase (NADPH/NADH) small chain